MPLAPSSLIDRWYTRSSFVYQSFSYLFKNPLWNKTVPQGFSLCPYWWLSMFSLLIFRPFVVVVLGLRWVAQKMRLTSFLRWTDSLFGHSDEPLGFKTALASTLLSLYGFVIGLVVQGAIEAHQFGVALPYTLWLVNVLVFVSCGAYIESKKGSSSRCPVEWYVRGSLFFSLLSLVIFHPTMTAATFLGLPWIWIKAVGAALVWFCVLLGHVIHYALVSSVWCMAGIVVLSVLMGIGFLIDRWTAAKTAALPLTPKPTREEVRYNLCNISNVLRYEYGVCPSIDDLRLAPSALALAQSKADLTTAEIKVHVSVIATDYIDMISERQKREAKRSANCKKLTSLLATVLSPITHYVVVPLATFFSYLWQMVKARKAGACPYLRFHD